MNHLLKATRGGFFDLKFHLRAQGMLHANDVCVLVLSGIFYFSCLGRDGLKISSKE